MQWPAALSLQLETRKRNAHPVGAIQEIHFTFIIYTKYQKHAPLLQYDGNQIFLIFFLKACDTVSGMAVDNQKILLNLQIKNNLRERAAELIDSRNWET